MGTWVCLILHVGELWSGFAPVRIVLGHLNEVTTYLLSSNIYSIVYC
jgi:hypothetical protein